MLEATTLLAAYLVGSVPAAYLVARARGFDILSIGTGNPGAANVFRSVGRGAGAVVFIADVLKAALPVALARGLGASEWVALAVGLAALAGHWYPVLLRFRGGAGIAPAVGVAVAMMPVPGAIAIVLGLATLAAMRSSGPAAALGAGAFLVSTLLLGRPVWLTLATAALLLLVGLRRYLLPFVGERPGDR